MIAAATSGLADFARFAQRAPLVAAKAASMTVNDAARWAEVRARRQFLQEVNLPADTLSKAKFGIVRTATQLSPEAIISASNNPLGLSRFVTGFRVAGRSGPTTRVKRGGSTNTWPVGVKGGDHAFLIPTPGGNGVGLAIRTKAPLRNSRAARKIGKNLYILYGPSLNQMFGNIAPALRPQIEARMAREFPRQFARLIRG